MSYVEVTGSLIGGVTDTVRWEDGEWTALEPVLRMIDEAKSRGVSFTPTSPFLDPESPRAAVILAVRVFEVVDSFDTDIPIEPEDLPPDAIA